MQIQTHIDKSGRVVIPKEIRDDMGLAPNQALTIEYNAQGIWLRPAEQPGMVQYGDIWCYQAQASETFDVVGLINSIRDER